jgi:hypothetical protein
MVDGSTCLLPAAIRHTVRRVFHRPSVPAGVFIAPSAETPRSTATSSDDWPAVASTGVRETSNEELHEGPRKATWLPPSLATRSRTFGPRCAPARRVGLSYQADGPAQRAPGVTTDHLFFRQAVAEWCYSQTRWSPWPESTWKLVFGGRLSGSTVLTASACGDRMNAPRINAVCRHPTWLLAFIRSDNPGPPG